MDTVRTTSGSRPPRRRSAPTAGRPRCHLAAALLIVTALWALPAEALPSAQGRITDLAGVIDPTTRAALQSIVDDLEHETGTELAIVTVTSLEGMTVEQYAERLFRAWGIGKKAADNGVLVLVCPAERVMRIEVGYGLEGVLPDGLAGAVIRQQFTPRFREGDYGAGVLDGVRRLAAILREHRVLSADEIARLEGGQDERPPAWATTPFLGLFVVLGAVGLGAGIRTRRAFPMAWGALFGGIPLILALIPFFNVVLWIVLPLAAAGFLLGFAKAEALAHAFEEGSGGGGAGPGGGPGGASASSRSRPASSRSSRGFGGGSSGGGGASGRW